MPEGLTFDSEEILNRLPDGLENSTDQYADECYGFVEAAVDMSGFIDNMEVPGEAQSGAKDSWQWTWHAGAESYTFYWTYEETATKRMWTMDIQYNNGPRYNYIDAWETLDGSQGEVIYNFQWIAVQEGEPIDEEDYLYWR